MQLVFTYQSHSPTVGSCCLLIPSIRSWCPLRGCVQETTSKAGIHTVSHKRSSLCLFLIKQCGFTTFSGKGYSHSPHTTQLQCVHCRCQASHRSQSTTHWPPTALQQMYRSTVNTSRPRMCNDTAEDRACLINNNSLCLWQQRRAGLPLCCT